MCSKEMSNVTKITNINKEITVITEKTKEFPVKKILIFVLSSVLIFSFITYTMVLVKESDLVKLHKQASVTQMDNIDIKTKVEFAKSLYNVQNKAETLTFLHKPEKVIEVDVKQQNMNLKVTKRLPNTSERIVSGY